MIEVLLIQCLLAQRVCPGEEVKRQGVEENLILEGKTVIKEGIIRDMIDLNLIIVMEDLSLIMVDHVVSIANYSN